MARGFFSLDPKLIRIKPTRKGHRNEILFSVLGKLLALKIRLFTC